jgi:plasmid stability protein
MQKEFKMPSIQIRNLSEKVYGQLKKKAKEDKRSIQQEASWLLENALNFQKLFFHAQDWGKVDSIRERMAKEYGVLPDSTSMIRDMRNER